MLKYLVVATALFAACSSEHRSEQKDATTGDAQADALVDAPPPPPPTVDAGPPPMMACTADAGTCELPPSTCLDSHYLIYYTGGDCVDGMCQYTTNLMYCPASCSNGGCLGGFT